MLYNQGLTVAEALHTRDKSKRTKTGKIAIICTISVPSQKKRSQLRILLGRPRLSRVPQCCNRRPPKPIVRTIVPFDRSFLESNVETRSLLQQQLSRVVIKKIVRSTPHGPGTAADAFSKERGKDAHTVWNPELHVHQATSKNREESYRYSYQYSYELLEVNVD